MRPTTQEDRINDSCDEIETAIQRATTDIDDSLQDIRDYVCDLHIDLVNSEEREEARVVTEGELEDKIEELELELENAKSDLTNSGD